MEKVRERLKTLQAFIYPFHKKSNNRPYPEHVYLEEGWIWLSYVSICVSQYMNTKLDTISKYAFYWNYISNLKNMYDGIFIPLCWLS